jgi:hypothetical protein
MAALPFQVDIMRDGGMFLISRNKATGEESRARFSSVEAARSWARRTRNFWLQNNLEKAIDLRRRRPVRIPKDQYEDYRPGGMWRKRFPRLDPQEIVRLFIRYGRMLERRKVGQK